MIEEYFRNDFSDEGLKNKPRQFNSNPEHYVTLSLKINEWCQRQGLVSESFLSTLCFPGPKKDSNKNWTKGRDKKKLIIIYEYLDESLIANNRRAGKHWIAKVAKEPGGSGSTRIEINNRSALDVNFTRITKTTNSSLNADRFYNGFPICFEDLKANFDFPRNSYYMENGIKDAINRHYAGELSSYILIKGVAGSGKTTLLRRIGYDLAERNKKVFLLDTDWVEDRRQSGLQTQIKQIADNEENDVVIMIDGLAACVLREELNLSALYDYCLGRKILFIFGEQPDRWNSIKNKLRAILAVPQFMPFSLSKLELNECDVLVDKMMDLESLQKLTSRSPNLTREERLSICRESADRHFLVAMLQTRFGKRFSDIIAEEFENIPSKAAKEAYLTVCFWHRWGFALPEGIFVACLGLNTSLDFNDLKSSTDELLTFTSNGVSARHRVIATEIFRNYILDKYQKHFHLIRFLSYLKTNKVEAATFLAAFLRNENIARILVGQLQRDSNLILDVISTIEKQKDLFDRDLYIGFLAFYAQTQRLLDLDDIAKEIYKKIISDYDETYSYAYRQIAWIENENQNFEEAARYALKSLIYSSDNANHLSQVARILAMNTVDNFHEADKYYREALLLSNYNNKYQYEYEGYLEAAKIIGYFSNLNNNEFIPVDALRLLKPNLRFIGSFFGVKSKEYKIRLLNLLHSMEGNVGGNVDDLNAIVEKYDIENDRLVKSKYYCNLGRVMYLDWYRNYGTKDPNEIYRLFKESLDLNYKDPFTHCWLGTYYKEAKKDFRLAEQSYRTAVELSENANHEYDKNHPLFKNNLALLIMEEVRLGQRHPKALLDAEDMLDFAVKMNEEKKLEFFWAEDNLYNCRKLIAVLLA